FLNCGQFHLGAIRNPRYNPPALGRTSAFPIPGREPRSFAWSPSLIHLRGTRRKSMVFPNRLSAAIVCGLACLSAMAAEKMPAPAPVPSSPARIPEGNEATVNGQAISRKAIFRSLKRVAEDRRAEERIRVVNFLIDNVLIDQEMVRLKVQADAK